MFKDYFDVTNIYVLHKLRIIFFPFTVKGEEGWKPKSRDFDSSPSLGSHDLNEGRDLQAADLYIPLMSFVTFILLNGC
jgi:protein transport protein YIF1